MKTTWQYRDFVIGEYVINVRHRFAINTHLDHIQAKMKILQDKELVEEIKNLQPSAHVLVDGDFHIDNSGPNVGPVEKSIWLLNSMNQTVLRSVSPLQAVETNVDSVTFNAIFKSFNVEIVKK